MNALASAQGAMRAWLLEGDAGLAGLVVGEDRAQRMRIYADAYRLRLADVLANDFPATRGVLGDAAFDRLARAYIDAHPSTTPSVRHFGRHFPDWLRQRGAAPRGAEELARFEWLQGECFDAADAPALAADALAALPPAAWPGLRLGLHPAVRMVATRRLRARDGRPVLAARATPIDWLLWRQDLDVHWRTLEADEAEALRALHDGVAFGGLCECLAAHHGDAAPLRAAALLKRWLADGVLATTTSHD